MKNDATAGIYQSVSLQTPRGNVACRYYPAPAAQAAVVYVGGVGGGWDTPAADLYPTLAANLTGERLAGLRVRFRDPTALGESVFDVLAGLTYLEQQGLERFGLVGHSFGGAVVIQAATRWPASRTVVTLATQSYGADAVGNLPPDCSILLMHGTADQVLPPFSSEYVYGLAHQPRQIKLLDGAGHVLTEAAAQVHQTVHDWLVAELSGKARPG